MTEQPPIQTTPVGALRFNTDSAKLEYFDGNQYVNITTDSPEQNTGGTRGLVAGGYTPTPSFAQFNTIDFFDASSSGNAIDFQKESVAGGLNLKTRMQNSKKHSTVGIEFGPHLERRFHNGVEVFFKGSAEAVSRYEHDDEMVPTGGPLQRTEQVGISGTVGLAR